MFKAIFGYSLANYRQTTSESRLFPLFY